MRGVIRKARGKLDLVIRVEVEDESIIEEYIKS